VERVVGAVTNILMLPTALTQLVLSSRRLQLGVVAAVLLLAAIAWWYQRCPHCKALVRRAGSAWLRCRRCGRQYHRGLRRVA
jgi:tRNA(Ile2) C34 agmatinyltransferase TiaS